MKMQIRRGLYETNSSSVHTLTVVKPGSIIQIPEFPQNTVKFGFGENGEPLKETVFDEYWQETSLWRRLATVYEYCFQPYSNTPLSSFIKRKSFLISAFKRLGFDCEFNESLEYLEDIESRRGETYDWEPDIFEDEDLLMRFVFSDKTDVGCSDRDWMYEHEQEISDKIESVGCVMYKNGE